MPSTRRGFLTSLAGTGAAAVLSGKMKGQSDEITPNRLMGVQLKPFVDPLPSPVVLRPSASGSGPHRCSITISEFEQKLHRDLPPTVVWGFQGTSPGPTIAAECDQPIMIHWLNRLPVRHRLAVDHNLDGAGKNVPDVRTTIHLHGGHVSASNDGYPEDWFTPGQQRKTFYANRQRGATLWYHDHAMGITRLNAMMGLAGLYLLCDPEEKRLGLPSGPRDVPLTLQDRILDARGQIVYPVSPDPEAPWVPEFLGTHVLVNGRVSPYLEVEPRLYRFRLLNASNARIFQLSLDPEQQFFQIATDGGLLKEPVPVSELWLAPGERAEMLIDFRGREGGRIMLVNYAPAPYPAGGGPVPGLVLQFRVNRPFGADGEADISRIPETLVEVPRLQEAAATKTRGLRLVETMPANGQPHRVLLDGRRFMDPVTEDPVEGSTEIWEFINTTLDTHPIHLHAVHFQLLGRQTFDVRRYQRTSEVVRTNKPIEPVAQESGWKDTIICPPGQVTRIITPFSGEPGRFVWHCHMLEHEDNEMMRPYLLRPRRSG